MSSSLARAAGYTANGTSTTRFQRKNSNSSNNDKYSIVIGGDAKKKQVEEPNAEEEECFHSTEDDDDDDEEFEKRNYTSGQKHQHRERSLKIPPTPTIQYKFEVASKTNSNANKKDDDIEIEEIPNSDYQQQQQQQYMTTIVNTKLGTNANNTASTTEYRMESCANNVSTPYKFEVVSNNNNHHITIPDNNHIETMEMEEDTSVIVPTITTDDNASSYSRMEGVIEDYTSIKPPLIVIDGANIAYSYAKTMTSVIHPPNTGNDHHHNKIEPDVTGIQIAVNYFLQHGLRVLVVLPAYFMETKPHQHDHNRNNSKMITSSLELLDQLKSSGLLVLSPPKDDDDAYVITIAKREDQKIKKFIHQHQEQQQFMGGYILSNDIFRDAIYRDTTNQLDYWLNGAHPKKGLNNYPTTGKPPSRISYTFCDMGTIDDFGDKILDIIPNPRHALIAKIEESL